MPPKGKPEVHQVVDVVDTQPSLENEAFVDELLHKAKGRDVVGVENAVAQVLGCADDFKIVLRSSILVDFVVEAILFASQHNYGARKTIMFVRWLTDMRASIESTGDVRDAKQMFRDQLVAHSERAAKEGLTAGGGSGGGGGSALSASAADALDGALDGGAGGAASTAAASSAKAPAAAAAKGGKEAKGGAGGGKGRGAAGADAADAAAGATRADAAGQGAIFSIADMGYVAEFVATGMLQHWRLWHLCCRDGVTWSAPTEFRMTVQLPMRPAPLSRSIPNDQWEQQQEELRKRAEVELAKLRQQEHDAAEAEQTECERREMEERLAREEQEASKLYFQRHGTETVVHTVHQQVETQLAVRQNALLQRLARLEELLKP